MDVVLGVRLRKEAAPGELSLELHNSSNDSVFSPDMSIIYNCVLYLV